MELDKNYIIYELQSQVSGLLRQEYLPEERPIESIFQIIYEPPFEEKESFEVFKTLNEENIECYFVIKSVWDKAEDCSKLEMPSAALKIRYKKILTKPTIKREKINIKKENALDMVSKLSNVKVSEVPDRTSAVLDGTSYELRINNCSFRWLEEGPDNWRELTEEVVKVLGFFRNINKVNFENPNVLTKDYVLSNGIDFDDDILEYEYQSDRILNNSIESGEKAFTIVHKDDFRDISINGRVAYAICCFENTLLSLNYNVDEWKMVLEYLWEFTSIEFLDDWEDIMCDIIPENLLEFSTYEGHDLEVLDEEQFKYLYNLYQNIDEKIDFVMSEIYNIAAHHLYSSIVGFGQSSIDEIGVLIKYMIKNNIPLPDIKPFEKFSITENRGWGNSFDGRCVSRIL